MRARGHFTNAIRNAAAVVVLLLFAGAKLGAVAHFVVVEHELCAEHGELVDGRASDTTRAGAPAAHGDAIAASASAASDFHGEHEHCGALAVQRDSSLLASSPVQLRAPLSSTLVTGEPRDGHVQLDARLRAPKTSPPGLLVG